jgi:flagellar L-ring protein FlgH
MKRFTTAACGVLCAVICCLGAYGKDKDGPDESLTRYLAKVRAESSFPGTARTAGSLWRDDGVFSDIASDYKARSAGDIVIISIVEQTLAQASGSVDSQRTFNTSSGVTGLVAQIATSGVNPLLAANSSDQLKGQAQTASTSSLKTSIAGRVVAVLPNGYLVIEARRNVLMNNERQTVTLRGVARPGDLTANNVVLSSQLSNLEIELRGKGAISDGTRRPNWVVRALLRLVNF